MGIQLNTHEYILGPPLFTMQNFSRNFRQKIVQPSTVFLSPISGSSVHPRHPHTTELVLVADSGRARAAPTSC
jgi:hypothetical protein